jgi:hypothetical protein
MGMKIVCGLEFVEKDVKMIVRKGKGEYLMVGIVGKDGKLKKFVMSEVDRWFGEKKEVEQKSVDVDW